MSKNQIALQFDSKQIDLIRNTVAKGATNDELEMFLYLASQYNLDPFKKEIWFMKYGNQTNIMTSRDGYLKYAQMNDEFEGLISFPVREGDDFSVDAANYTINHKFGAKRGKILGAWARCDRRGKKPFIAYVEFSEYNKNSNIWRTYPSAMIQKVAEVFVLKRAFGINGLVTKEELESESAEDAVEVEYQEVDWDSMTIDKEQQKHLFTISDGNPNFVKQAIEEKGFTRTSEITNKDYAGICERIVSLVKESQEQGDVEELDFEEVPVDGEVVYEEDEEVISDGQLEIEGPGY